MFQRRPVLVTGLVLACNAPETVADHLNRHGEGGGDCLRESHGEPGMKSMSIMKTLSRMGAALKYAQDARKTERMLNGLTHEIQMDIGWPVMPTTKHLSSNIWGGLR
jgi:hypothetical protein